MADSGLRWILDRFVEQLDSWIERESPAVDLRLIVTAWVMTRNDDPYVGVRREPAFENLWFGAVPDSDDGAGSVVACSYWIDERLRIVRCNSIATLNLPLSAGQSRGITASPYASIVCSRASCIA